MSTCDRSCSPGQTQVLACISCLTPGPSVKNIPLPLAEVMLSREDPNLNPGKLILTLMCYVTFQILAQVTLYVGGDIPMAHPSASDSRQC